MSDDEADPELLALLRAHLGLGPKSASAPPETEVLKSAEYIFNNSVDVMLDMRSTQAAAEFVWSQTQIKHFTTKSWTDDNELHPKSKDEAAVNFIFTMDLLNFSFWSEKGEDQRFAVEYRGQKWTGYWSLVAALQRALDEGVPITSPDYWHFPDDESAEERKQAIRNVFRSSTEEEMPLLDERIAILREASEVLCKNYDMSVLNLVSKADHSAARLVNMLAEQFDCFNDQTRFERKKVHFMKRAQIFVADLWAAFEGEGYGHFDDIDKITMFADYRVPQMLHSMGAMYYSPPLENRIKSLGMIELNHTWELQIRGCTIWCVELIRKEIKRKHPESQLNAVLIDFFLYDAMKDLEANIEEPLFPHHRTRSIWY